MKLSPIANALWGHDAKLRYLLLAAFILLFTLLGGKEIWTQEHRWADIVFGMFYRHDFLHPYLGQNTYYDKPLLSYWLIALLAKVSGALTTWQLRLPSALAGFLAIWSIYRLGMILKDKQLGLIAGWLLLTTFYFLFWARTSSADMLNLAGTVFAIAWYFEHQEKPGFYAYSTFFSIVALTCLCKGLVGAIVPAIAILTDIVLQKSWKQHLRPVVFLSVIPAAIIYLLPFWASSHFGGNSYGENGLYLVYRENILRYFQPFDHEGPIYTYFIYLPIYLLPWAIFFIPALFTLPSRWKHLSRHSKWIAWTLFCVFMFFTLSGSRRSYYVLPIVPFAILFTADWLARAKATHTRRLWSAGLVAFTYVFLFLAVDVIPAWYYSQVGVERFAQTLKADATKVQPWQQWNVVMLDAESKLSFYLQLPPTIENLKIKGTARDQQTAQTLLAAWPILINKPANTIFISRKIYAAALQGYFPGYQMIELPAKSSLPFLQTNDVNAAVAFVPAQ